MTPETLVIVNPASAGGSTARRWPVIRDLLHQHFDFDVAFSQHAGHTVQIGREARLAGLSRVVCVGGDGTLHEVVNGLYGAQSDLPMPEIGIVPTGTGADFVRSVGIPHNAERACVRLAHPIRQRTDLGVVSFTGGRGPERRYFVNAAGLGYDAEVVSRRNGFNHYVRGTLPYLASLGTTLLTYRNKELRISVEGSTSSRRVNALVLAIGRFFGGGMRIAPNADPTDGFFDAVTIGDVGRLELVYNVPGVYRGTHLRNPKVSVERVSAMTVESSERVLVQADGELLGELPARFEIIPGALTILC